MAGAYHNAVILSAVASAAIKRGQLLEFTSGKVKACDAASDQVLGVYDLHDNDDVATGATLGVVVQGQAHVFAGAAITAGDPIVVCTASGLEGYAAPLSGVSLSAGQGCHIAGIALEDAVKDQAFAMLTQPQFYVKRSN